jgi:hypothetical protein
MRKLSDCSNEIWWTCLFLVYPLWGLDNPLELFREVSSSIQCRQKGTNCDSLPLYISKKTRWSSPWRVEKCTFCYQIHWPCTHFLSLFWSFLSSDFSVFDSPTLVRCITNTHWNWRYLLCKTNQNQRYEREDNISWPTPVLDLRQ